MSAWRTYSKWVTLGTGAEQIEALVSCKICTENGRFFTKNFRTNLFLSPDQVVEAIDELIDKARTQPNSHDQPIR